MTYAVDYSYTYEATLLRVLDADTVEMRVDLGFYVSVVEKFRLYGINAPEMNTDAGKAAKARVEELIGKSMGVHNGLDITTVKDKRDKYGRMLVIIHYGSTTLNEKLLEEGHAVEYFP